MKKAIILSVMLALVLTGCGLRVPQASKILTPDEAKAQITDFINTQLLAAAPYKATVDSISEANGLYKMSIDVNNQKIDTYMTKDATIFFPQAIDMTKKTAVATSTASNQPAPTAEVSKKTAKPTVELFVMSQCPYGTQIEKGILPVVAALGKKIDFAVKFCDYSMHGQGEVNEEMSQYCIQKNEPQNYQAYLKCYLGSAGQPADAAACVKSTKVNAAKLASCVATTDKTYSITAGYNDKSTWVSGQFPQFNIFKADNTKYGVQGSPTLVINGETVSPARDSASLLKTICSAFTTAPAECQTTLSADTPSAGFGYAAGSAASSGATCNTPTQQ
ncbi:MAG: thioredoxin domain-containing protein [Patescibacteria group bacterium]|nr:thioredoxin domain-containing protein [Patescibacteria group bacterium]